MSFEPGDREQVEEIVGSVRRAALDQPRQEYSLAAVDPSGLLVAFARLAVDTVHPRQNSGQIGFAVRADQWGKGIGGQVVNLLCRLAFDDMGLYRVWGARSPVNESSARVMGRAGMIEEGVIRGHIRVGDGYRDSVVHSILLPEWKTRTAA